MNSNNYLTKQGDESLLKRDISTPAVLRLIYNVIYMLCKIKFFNYLNESRFLLEILLKFALISPGNRKFLANEIKLLLPLKILIGPKIDQKEYEYNRKEIFNFSKGEFIAPHEVLNPQPGQRVEGDRDRMGKFINLDYIFMLFCCLDYTKEKKKDELKKNPIELYFSFYNANYFLSLTRYCKTKQDIKYLSKLISFKCSEDKNIFDLVMKHLFDIWDVIKDLDTNYFDESDEDTEAEIYKNTGENTTECSHKTLKKNVSFILRKLAIEAKGNFGEYKIKTILSKLFSFYSKNKKYYSRAIMAVNTILNIFESIKIDNKKYLKDLNDILNWLNKFKVPPKHYEIKGINMYKQLPAQYHRKEMNERQKSEYEKKEIENTNKKIERLKQILLNKNLEYNISKFDGDLSDFKFTFGDVISIEKKEYEIINVLDEMIRVKLVEKNDLKEWEDIWKDKKTNKKKMTISEKEKIKFWVETDNYQLRIKNLVDIST